LILKLFNNTQIFVSYVIGLTYLIFPTVLDQYSFYTATTFVLGETLVLIGYYFLYIKSNYKICLINFILSLAIYQPIIALIILIPLLLILYESISTFEINFKFIKLSLFCILVSTILSQIPNYFIYKYIISTPRFSDFDLKQIISQIINTPIYVFRFFRYCFYANTNVFVRFIPLLLFFLFNLVMLYKSKNKFCVAVFLLLIPFVLQSVFILSSGKAELEGRSHSVYAIFFVISALLIIRKLPTKFSTLLVLPYLIVLFIFSINILQITNYLTYKNIYDKNYLNRVVARIEPLIDLNKKYKIVILGKIPDYWIGNNIRYANYLPHSTKSFFQPYRHVEILNYWLGSEIFSYPDKMSINIAKLKAFNLKSYPNLNCILLNDDLLVLKLSDTDQTTWSKEQFSSWYK
jgi:hypothetical protein